MIVHINQDWQIASDPLQWIVQRRRTVKGRDKWDSISFHHTLDSAVIWLARRHIRMLPGSYGPQALPALCQVLDSLTAEIRSALSHVRGVTDNRPPSGPR